MMKMIKLIKDMDTYITDLQEQVEDLQSKYDEILFHIQPTHAIIM